MKRILIFYIMLIGFTFNSCSDDETLTPSGKEDGYTISKGDADYDQIINDFFKKYSTCLLYDWNEKDAYWTPSGWQNGVLGTEAEGGKSGFVVYAPQKEYITKQLHLLERLWFRFYSTKALQELLPYTILLCSNVQETEVSWIWEPTFSAIYIGKDVSAHYNYQNIAVSFASDKVDNLTNSDSLRICQELNRVFFESMEGRNRISIPKKFSEGINYDKAGYLYNNSEFFERGIFPDTKTYSPSASNDWVIFLNMMVSYSYDFLSRESQTDLPEWTHDGDDFYEGILNPAKDKNGLYKKRYDIVRQYFIDNFDTDLQVIGNYATNWK